MQVVKDAYGQEVSIGDFLVHVTKGSEEIHIHYSVVYGFIWRGYKNARMLVVSVTNKHYGGTLDYYRTSLTVDNFVRIPMEAVPAEIKEGLLKVVMF